MKTARKHLYIRVVVLLLIGIFCFIIDTWAADNYEMFRVIFEFGILSLGFLFAIAEDFRGRLRASPIYKATFGEASEENFVQILLAVYLLVIMVAALYVSLNKNLADAIQLTPVILYSVAAPVFLILFFGKYAVEKDKNEF